MFELSLYNPSMTKIRLDGAEYDRFLSRTPTPTRTSPGDRKWRAAVEKSSPQWYVLTAAATGPGHFAVSMSSLDMLISPEKADVITPRRSSPATKARRPHLKSQTVGNTTPGNDSD